jgi:hypothetical protein
MKPGSALRKGALFFLILLAAPAVRPQDQPPNKQAQDYMSAIMSRNTKPLGLAENKRLNELMRQPNIKWAIRAASRHILD